MERLRKALRCNSLRNGPRTSNIALHAELDNNIRIIHR